MTPIANQSPGPFESSARASEKRQTSWETQENLAE